LNWTSVMSSFVLRRFTKLVGEGVKTNKGVQGFAYEPSCPELSEWAGMEVSGSQVYNHLYKWHARWDEELFMITLAPEHYSGHVKDHPKDDEFLNIPLVNYPQMQAIFSGGVATRRFAIGSNEPPGDPTDVETIDVDANAHVPTKATAEGSDCKGKSDGQTLGKRKRVTAEEEGVSMQGLTDAIWGFAGAVTSSIHVEGTPGIMKANMGCSNFCKVQLMFCLDHLMEHKWSALGFIDMDNEERDLWLACHLSKHGMPT
ncbi:hypothetical protein SETIT_9G328500v2, partial [Setaria italica]